MSSFGQMAAMGQQAKRNRMQAMTDIDWFNAETARIGATKPQPSPAQPAKPQGLAAAKTPTFSTMISPQGSQGVGTASAASYGKMPAGWDNSSAPTSLPINEGQPGSGTIGRTLYSTDAAGQTTIPTREGYQTDGAGIPEVKDDGLGVGGLKEGGIIERVGNILGLRKPLEAPQQNANRVADQFGGLSGEAARSIRARPRQIEEELKRQGLKRGTAFVKDKAGKGSPVKDTVDAKLAEGEAVLNAGAAEMMGRDEIERLNIEGAEKLGLRGGAKMVDGVMHAAAGAERIKVKEVRDALKLRPTTAQLLGEADDVMKQSDELYKSGKTINPAGPTTAQVAAAGKPPLGVTPPPKLTLRGAGRTLGGAAALGSYMALPEEDKVSALQGFGPIGTMVGLAGKAMQPLRDKLYAPAYAAGDKVMANVKSRIGMSDQAAASVAAPKPAEIPVMELSGAPTALEQGMRAQVETRKGDNAAFSKFFNENGITDEMRANPAQAGLRRVNVPGSTDRIYQRGKNEFVGMGAPSRIAAETARANDPAVQKAAQMKELYTLATQGNEQAGETLRQIIKADSDREVEGLRAQATVQAAGAKGSGKKGSGEDGGLKLAEQFKYAEGARGEDDQMSMLRGLDERKRGAWTELQAEFDNPKTTPERKLELEKKWAQIEQGAYTQDNLAKTDLLLGAKQAGADNTATGMGAKYGLLGGAVAGLGALYAARKGNFKLAKTLGATALGGGLSAAAGYKYGGGSEGIDENSDLYDIESMNLTADGTKITNGVQTISFDSLSPQVQRLFLQKRLSRQQ